MKKQIKQDIFFTLLALACLYGFVSFGLWQLGRADEKLEIQARHDAKVNAPPVALLDIADWADLNQYQFHPATGRGYYDPEQQLFLNHQIRDHRPGFEVLTPFEFGNDKLVLVNRGWIPHSGDYTKLPYVPVDREFRELSGYLSGAPGIGLKLGEPQMNEGWPKIIQYVEWDYLATLFPNQQLLPYIMRLDKSEPDGFRRDWKIVAFSPDKHKGYAVQWFSFGFVIVVLYALYWIKREKSDE